MVGSHLDRRQPRRRATDEAQCIDGGLAGHGLCPARVRRRSEPGGSACSRRGERSPCGGCAVPGHRTSGGSTSRKATKKYQRGPSLTRGEGRWRRERFKSTGAREHRAQGSGLGREEWYRYPGRERGQRRLPLLYRSRTAAPSVRAQPHKRACCSPYGQTQGAPSKGASWAPRGQPAQDRI